MTAPTRTATTAAIQAWRALNRPPDERWVDWAVRLLTQGADTPGLRILAGLLPPLDYFEATKLVDRTLIELAISPLDTSSAVEAYTAELLAELLRHPDVIGDVLGELAQLCIETSYSRDLMKFYLLRNARDDLTHRDMQHYWAGADRSNIDGIVRQEAQRWLDEHKRAA